MGIVALECPPNIRYYSFYSHSNSHPDALCSLKSFKGIHAAIGNETNGLLVPRMTKKWGKQLPPKGPRLWYSNLWNVVRDSSWLQHWQVLASQSGTNILNFDKYLQYNWECIKRRKLTKLICILGSTKWRPSQWPSPCHKSNLSQPALTENTCQENISLVTIVQFNLSYLI